MNFSLFLYGNEWESKTLDDSKLKFSGRDLQILLLGVLT